MSSTIRKLKIAAGTTGLLYEAAKAADCTPTDIVNKALLASPLLSQHNVLGPNGLYMLRGPGDRFELQSSIPFYCLNSYEWLRVSVLDRAWEAINQAADGFEAAARLIAQAIRLFCLCFIATGGKDAIICNGSTLKVREVLILKA